MNIRLAAGVAMVLLGQHVIAADPGRFEWPVFIAAGSYVYSTPEATIHDDALSTFIEFRYRSTGRSWSTSLFLDYRLSREIPDTLKTGVMFRFGNGDWDSLAALFWNDSRNGPDFQGYAGRIRYRLAPKHKIGIESFGPLQQLDSAYLMVGYYGDVSSVLSVRLAAGVNFSQHSERAARVELVWQVN